MNERDIGYIAGLVDGEGCIGICRQKRHGKGHYVRLLVVNTNREVLEWLKAKLGGDICMHRANSSPLHWKTSYQWRLSGGKAEIVLRLVYDSLIVKCKQAELALKLQDTKEYYDANPGKGPGPHRVLTDTAIDSGENIRLAIKALNVRGRPLLKEDTWTSQPESF